MSFSKIVEYLKQKNADKSVNVEQEYFIDNNDYPDFQTFVDNIQELEPMPKDSTKEIYIDVKKSTDVINDKIEGGYQEQGNNDIHKVDVSNIDIKDMDGGDIQEMN